MHLSIKYLLLLHCLLAHQLVALAQEDTDVRFQTLINYGVALGQGENIQIQHGSSYVLGINSRVLKPVSSYYAWGVDIGMHVNSFRLKEGTIVPPSAMENDKEKLIFTGLDVELFNRLYPLGKAKKLFVDVGIKGQWEFFRSYQITRDSPENVYQSEAQLFEYRNPDYTTVLNGLVDLQVGMGWVAIFGRYRFTRLIKPKTGVAMPHFVLGIQLGGGKNG